MALYIRSEQVDSLARELAEATGETMTEAVGKALKERLERVKPYEPGPAELERRELAFQHLMRAREMLMAAGWRPPTKEEIDAMWDVGY